MSKSSKSAKGRKQKLNFDMATDLVDNTVVVGSLLGPTTATPLFAGDVSASEIVSLMRDEFSVDSQNAAFDHTVADRISNELMNLLHVIRFDIGVIKNRWLRQLETLRRGWHLVIVIEYKRSSKMKPEYMVVNQRPRHYEDVSRLARAELSKTIENMPASYEVISGGYLAETFRFKKQMLDLELMVDEAIKLLEANHGHSKN